MTFYGTPEQCEKMPGFYKELPKEYLIELMKKMNENQTKKDLENRIFRIYEN